MIILFYSYITRGEVIDYTVPSFPVLEVKLTQVKYAKDNSMTSYDGFIRETSELVKVNHYDQKSHQTTYPPQYQVAPTRPDYPSPTFLYGSNATQPWPRSSPQDSPTRPPSYSLTRGKSSAQQGTTKVTGGWPTIGNFDERHWPGKTSTGHPQIIGYTTRPLRDGHATFPAAHTVSRTTTLATPALVTLTWHGPTTPISRQPGLPTNSNAHLYPA